jgi:CheY-like chemotaxis protein
MDLANHFLTYATPAAFHPERKTGKTNVLVAAKPVMETNSITSWSQIEGQIPDRTILVVDDEPSILSYIRRVLEQANYNIVTSPSGNDALEIIQRGQPKIDLVLTDIVMPGSIDGLTLASKIQRKNPKLPILFITGALLEDDESAARCAIKNRLLQKPFSPTQLVEFIDSHFLSRIGTPAPPCPTSA